MERFSNCMRDSELAWMSELGQMLGVYQVTNAVVILLVAGVMNGSLCIPV